ncbi:hypothetical protein HYT23_04535 [Candidatus Pacearchaeota archaeon]|nr:hypothetical protein [Candidatus Pacearchaeota archaeon]
MIKKVEQIAQDLGLPEMNVYRTYFSFIGQNNRWRTLDGVSRDTGLERNVVNKIVIDNSDFIISPIEPNGTRLYGLRI